MEFRLNLFSYFSGIQGRPSADISKIITEEKH